MNETKKQEKQVNDDTLLSVKNLSVEYVTEDGTVKAVNGVSFDLRSGETLGLVGETGAGKTTIAKSIMRILLEPPAKIKEGEILFENEDLLKLPKDKMRIIRGNKISMIFQDPMTSLNPTRTVGLQIADVFRAHNKVSRKEAKKRAIEILEKVGIMEERYNDYPHQFSGGMKQRVIIAMALACRPKLLLSDEATTALDVTIQAQVLEMIQKLKKEFSTSTIMITHDLGIVAETCDSVAVIYAGEVVEYGSVYDIFDCPSHPYTIGLFGTLPNINDKVKRLKPIPGMMPDPTELPLGCKFLDRCPYAQDECKNSLENVELTPGHKVFCTKASMIYKERYTHE